MGCWCSLTLHPAPLLEEITLIWEFLFKSSIPKSWQVIGVRNRSAGMLFPLSLFMWQMDISTWHCGSQKSCFRGAKEVPVPFLLQQLGNPVCPEKKNQEIKFALPFRKRWLLRFFLRLWICSPSECDSARPCGQRDIGYCQAAEARLL